MHQTPGSGVPWTSPLHGFPANQRLGRKYVSSAPTIRDVWFGQSQSNTAAGAKRSSSPNARNACRCLSRNGQRAFLTYAADRLNVRSWQILLQKSQKAQRLIFRQRTKQATIADQ